MSDDGKLHYEAWCEADVRGYGPPWESIPPLLRALHDRVAALFIKRVGAERDAAIAERDRLRREKTEWRMACLDAEQERDAAEKVASRLLFALHSQLGAYQDELVKRSASMREFSAPTVPGGDLSSHAAEVQRIADELAVMLAGKVDAFPPSSEAEAEAHAMGCDPQTMRAEGASLAGALLDARRTREQERDAAIAERDRLRAQVTDLLPEADAAQHFATRALRAEDRLDRLRRELEALRADPELLKRVNGSWFADRLNAILRGEP